MATIQQLNQAWAAFHPSPVQESADGYLFKLLLQYGLANLAGWAWDQVAKGQTPDQVIISMRDTPEYKARFPGLALRQQNGYGAISEAQYISTEDAYKQAMRAAGLPENFYTTPAELATMIGNDVSPAELNQRITQGVVAAQQAPQSVRDQLQNYYGIDSGHLAAYYLDPQKALPLLQQQFASAQIGAEALGTGYGNLTKAQSEGLAALGVTDPQAQQGFTKLGLEQQLFAPLPGEQGPGISKDQQLAAQFGGNAPAQLEIERRARERVADFSGGQYGITTKQGQEGAAGVGAAPGV